MGQLKKYKLPYACKLSHIKFDLHKLREALIPFAEKFTDIYSVNKGLCFNHEQLVSSIKDHFFEVSLTTCSSSSNDVKLISKKEGLTRTQNYRLAISRRTDHPELDEHNWRVPTKLFQDSYFYKCVNQFKAPAIRVRLTTLNSGKTLVPHIDYNVDYAVRIVVPIYTNEKCLNKIWIKGKQVKFHIPADGHPWFLNVGLRHAVENLGASNRIILMFSLAGTEDIQYLGEKNVEANKYQKMSLQ